MEFLHTLVNGIDSVKEHLSDNEYLNMMNAIGKLGEIINKEQDDSDDNGSELESVIETDDEESEVDDEEPEVDDSNSDDNIIVLDLFLEVMNNNELVFNKYISDKNLPEDFINSRFNMISKSAYNYIINKTCNCNEEYDLCSGENLLSCKNYQSFILKFPLIHIITQDCEHCKIIISNQINKYNLISFDGNINTSNNTPDEFFNKYSNVLIKLINNVSPQDQVLLLINFFLYLFENGHLIIKSDKLKQCCWNKLLTEGTNPTLIQHMPYWANLLDFNPDIINNMVNNLIELN